MATKDEQETTITYSPMVNEIHVYSSVPKHLRRLRSDARATEKESGDDYGFFTIPVANFDVLTGFKRNKKPMTPAQREAAAKRLEAARQAKG